MNMFDVNTAEHAKAFARQGYVFIPGGVTEAFHQYMVTQVDRYMRERELKNFAIGNKQQSLFKFPDDRDGIRQIFELVQAVTGLDAKRLILSERHIKSYEADADPNPHAHKDRYASEISIGLSIKVPKGSRLVLYPHDHTEVNQFNSAAGLRSSLSPDESPEKYLASSRKVEYEDSPRDILLFRGNAIWHLRSNPANTVNLYLKVNSFHCDPLGEDPRSEDFRKSTLAVAGMSDEEMLNAVPMIGHRVDYVHRQYNRQWEEMVGVVLWGENHFSISQADLDLMKSMDGKRTLRSLMNGRSGAGLDRVRRLALRGVVDLLRSGS